MRWPERPREILMMITHHLSIFNKKYILKVQLQKGEDVNPIAQNTGNTLQSKDYHDLLTNDLNAIEEEGNLIWFKFFLMKTSKKYKLKNGKELFNRKIVTLK